MFEYQAKRFEVENDALRILHHIRKREASEQSPINIDTSKVILNTDLRRLVFINYDKNTLWRATNTNETIKFYPLNTTAEFNPKFYDQNLHQEYYLQNFHFHWAHHDNGRGSEHFIDNRSFPLEVIFQ